MASEENQPPTDPFPGIPLKQVSTIRRKGGEKDQPKANEVFFINEVQLLSFGVFLFFFSCFSPIRKVIQHL